MTYDRNLGIKVHRAASKRTIVNVGGIEIPVMQEGSGHPIVFLQGLSCNMSIWDRWAERLKANFSVIRFDLPQVGSRKNADNGTHIVHYIELIDHLLKQLGLHSFHLVGSSFGGQLACEYTFRFQQKVKKLVLISPSGFTLHTDLAISNTLKSSMFHKNRQTPSKPVSVRQLPAFYHNKEMGVMRKWVKSLGKNGKDSKIHEFDNLKHITELNHPTLLLWGEQDAVVPVSDANKFRTFMTNVRLVVFPDAGHFVFDEYIGKTYKTLKDFL